MKPGIRRWWRYPQAERLINRYLALTAREQLLLRLTLHTLIILIPVLLVLEPLWRQIGITSDKITQAEAETRQWQQQVQSLREKPQDDPDEPLRQQLAQLAGEQQLLDQRIGQLTGALVTPGQMVPLLKALLAQDESLQLLGLSTLPQQTIEIAGNNAAVIYRHGLRLHLKATYSGLIAYQQRLDQLHWQIYWQTLDYRVTGYPYAEVQIELYTLSLSEEVVGG